MYTVYISRYEEGGNIITTPLCIYDRRSPDKELACLNPKVNLEDSRAGSFSFILPPTHFAIGKINKEKTMVSVYRIDTKTPISEDESDFMQEKLIFEGPIKNSYGTFDKNIQYSCEGFFTFFNDSVQPYVEYFDISLSDFIKALISKHNEHQPVYKQFDVDAFECEVEFPETDYSGEKKHLSQFEATQYDTTMTYILALQNAYGGHFIFGRHKTGDMVGPTGSQHEYVEGTDPPYIIKYVKNLPVNNGQVIEFGHNLSDYDISYDFTNICSTVVPVSSVSSDDLGTVGETIASSDKIYWIDDQDQRHYYDPDHWADYTDERNISCMAKYYPNVTDPNKYVECLFYPDRPLVKASEIPGHYIVDMNTMGEKNTYRVLRYFIRNKDERLYISSRLNDIGDEYNCMWTLYAYTPYQNILGYRKQTEDGFETISDYEINVSKTEDGKDLYVDHTNSTGEILVFGWGDDVPTCIKRAKYSYSVDHSIGASLNLQQDAGTTLYRMPNDDPSDPEQTNPETGDPTWQPPWKYNPFSLNTHDVWYYYIQPDDEALLLTVRTTGTGDGVDYIGDGLWALYDGYDYYKDDPSDPEPKAHPSAWGHNQLNYAKLNNEGFTSEINLKIDLKDADNIGSRLLLVSSYGTMITPELHRYNKYVDKLERYLTVEGADADRYHEEQSLYVTSPELEAIYGRIERKIAFSGIEDPNVLLKRAEAYLVDSQWANMEVNITAVDLHATNPNIEAIDISTQVRARSYPHDLDRLFTVKSLSFSLDAADSETYKFTETNTGYYKGLLPISVLTSSDELRNVILYGTENGIGTYDSDDDTYYIHLVITNLLYEDPITHELVPKTYTIDIGNTQLVYPNAFVIGTVDDFREGLIEITTTEGDILSDAKPIIEFIYDKDKNGV